MSAFLISLISTVALVGVAARLLHPRHAGGVTLFSFGVLILFVTVTAFPREWQYSFDIEDYIPEGEVGDYYYVAEDALCQGVCRAVSERFGFPEDNISVVLINFEFEKMRAETVMVTLSGAAALGDLVGVADFVDNIGIGRCIVDVQIG